MNKNQLMIIPKVEKYIEYMLTILIKLPRTEKFSIGTEIKTSMYEMLKNILFASKINKKGRLNYITNKDKQENIVDYFNTTDKNFWLLLAKENRLRHKEAKAGGKCCEARELIIGIPQNSKIRAEELCKIFKARFEVECACAIHQNNKDGIINKHCHLIFSERKLLTTPEIVKEKRVNKIKRKVKKLNNDNSKSSEKSMIGDTIDTIWLNEKLTNMYEERIRELQEQVIYFKKLFEDEKNDKIKIQNYILKKFESL